MHLALPADMSLDRLRAFWKPNGPDDRAGPNRRPSAASIMRTGAEQRLAPTPAPPHVVLRRYLVREPMSDVDEALDALRSRPPGGSPPSPHRVIVVLGSSPLPTGEPSPSLCARIDRAERAAAADPAALSSPPVGGARCAQRGASHGAGADRAGHRPGSPPPRTAGDDDRGQRSAHDRAAAQGDACRARGWHDDDNRHGAVSRRAQSQGIRGGTGALWACAGSMARCDGAHADHADVARAAQCSGWRRLATKIRPRSRGGGPPHHLHRGEAAHCVRVVKPRRCNAAIHRACRNFMMRMIQGWGPPRLLQYTSTRVYSSSDSSSCSSRNCGRKDGSVSFRVNRLNPLPRTLTSGSVALIKCCLPCGLAPFCAQ